MLKNISSKITQLAGLAVVVGTLAAVAQSASAAAPGGRGGAAAGVSAPGGFGGASGDHIGSRGLSNTNGPNATDRSVGFDRAQQRMNQQGVDHNKATGNQQSGVNSGTAVSPTTKK